MQMAVLYHMHMSGKALAAGVLKRIMRDAIHSTGPAANVLRR
jgi:hypothetical protein